MEGEIQPGEYCALIKGDTEKQGNHKGSQCKIQFILSHDGSIIPALSGNELRCVKSIRMQKTLEKKERKHEFLTDIFNFLQKREKSYNFSLQSNNRFDIICEHSFDVRCADSSTGQSI